jgi:micrococcal nuclease
VILAELALAATMTSFYNVKILSVYDGDTLKAEIANVPAVFSPIGVRIKGIDAPEMHDKRPCVRKDALLAKAAMVNLVESGKVDLLFCEHDKYVRLLCSLRVDHKFDGSEFMLERGLATPYAGEKKRSWTCK